MIEAIITAGGLGVGAGVNAYATFLVFGLLARFYPGLFQGDLAAFFASTPVLIVVAILYGVEFLADKFPALDHAWDAVHTIIRPLAGALVALASATPDMPKPVLAIAVVAGGGAALGSHTIKAMIRGASTVTTGGLANPVLSLIEDVFAVLQALMSVFLPWLFLGLVVIVGLPTLMLLLLRFFRRGEASF